MSPARGLLLANGAAAPDEAVPVRPFGEFGDRIVAALGEGARVAALLAERAPPRGRLLVVLASPRDSRLELLRTEVGERYASLTPRAPALHLFEREILEQAGVVPEGHPRLEPVRARLQEEFATVAGEEVHEVAVGPVHAGVIEPGHFRFQCAGETVLTLEIALGYQHRGIEAALVGGPDARTIHRIETTAGDTTIGHATAYARCFEALTGGAATARGEALRALALELERLANHTGDLGALSADVGFLPTAAWCGRLRGDWLNLTAELCGSRFGRGLVRPFGAGFDVEPERAARMSARVEAALRDVEGAAALFLDSATAVARCEGTGPISTPEAAALGLVGPAARASGLLCDARVEFPLAAGLPQIPRAGAGGGDVLARAEVRLQEIRHSARFVRELLSALPAGPPKGERSRLRGGQLAAALVEGWRGEICHVARTGPDGRFAHWKIVDPSFKNWIGLAQAMRGQAVSDFPLVNKSFNLSYCGHDL